MASSFFWTDAQQAQERLQNSVILYDDIPHYVSAVEAGSEGIPRLYLAECSPARTASRKMSNSPKFKRFRELPKLGWMNSATGAALIERAAATTRVHGLTRANVSILSFRKNAAGRSPLMTGQYSFDSLMYDKGFCDSHQGNFPSLDKILQNIVEESAIAYSRLFCVYRDEVGLRWLYRNKEAVGVFTGTDTLMLLSKFSFLREEIMDDKAFTLNNIREF